MPRSGRDPRGARGERQDGTGVLASTPSSRPRHRVGRKRVARLMREEGLEGQRKRRFRATTDSKHALPIAPNVLAAELHGAGAQQGLGRRTSPTSGPARAGCTWRRSSTCTRDVSSAGRWSAHHRSQPGPRCPAHGARDRGARRRAWSTTPTAAVQYASDGLPGHCADARHGLQHEPQGRLLGQRRCRELLRHAQGRARPPHRLRDPQPGPDARSSSTSRSSTTAAGATRPSATSVLSSTKLRPSKGTGRLIPLQPCGAVRCSAN